MRGMKVLAGTSHVDLAAKMARWLNVGLTPCTVNKFSNNETNVVVDESIRENDVFVVQTGGAQTNDRVMELVVMLSACKLASAKRVTAIIPLYFYSKQSKRKSRSAITGKLVANMLKVAGVDHIITMDLHASQMQGFFSVPVDNLFAEPSLAAYIKHNITDYEDGVVVAKNPGGMKRVTSLADRLCINFAMIFSEKPPKSAEHNDDALVCAASLDLLSNHTYQDDTITMLDGPSSSSPHMNGVSLIETQPRKKEKHQRVVGEVSGRVCFLADDMIDGVKSYCAAAKTLMDSGAKRVYIVATHGVFADDGLQRINDDPNVHEVIVTNTVSLKGRTPLDKIRVIDISSVFAEAIRRTHNGETLSFLISHNNA